MEQQQELAGAPEGGALLIQQQEGEEADSTTNLVAVAVALVACLVAAAFYRLFFQSPSSKKNQPGVGVPPSSSSGGNKAPANSSSSSSKKGAATGAVGSLAGKGSAAAGEEEKGVPLRLLWGSQTGTAEDFATQLADEARKHGFAPRSTDLEDFSADDLASEGTVVFVVATYGEGEPTDNAKDFYAWLMDDDRQPDLLERVRFAVFGLGNRTYEHYNAIGRAIDRRMEELSAHRFYEKGEGDDDSSLEEDFAKWKKGLWGPLCRLHGLPFEGGAAGEDTAEDYQVKARNVLVYVDHASEEGQLALQRLKETGHAIGTRKQGVHDLKNPLICEVVVNRELHGSTSERSCRHIEIAIPDTITYEPGDHVGVYANNDPALVLALAARLGVEADLDRLIALAPAAATGAGSAKKGYSMGPVTLRQALLELVDITTPPRKSLLHALVQYARSEKDAAVLKALSGSSDQPSQEPQLQYAQWVKEDRRTIGEVLEALPSVEVPVGHLLELLPALAPRYYSISSSPLEHPRRLHITCVVTRFVTRTGRLHHGVCSTHFLRLLPDRAVGTDEGGERPATVPLFVRKSQFRLPKSPSTPLIMVGPGTGIAPFRGFIHHRKHLDVVDPTSGRGEAVLFFGCRERAKDFLYEDELNAALASGHLSSVLVAFSREQTEKVYVQDRLREHKDLVWRLLDESNAHFYICGDAAQMAPAVRAAVVDIVAERLGGDRERAEAYVAALHEQGRWATDVWF
jgi:NADPH-ferrihemoprotein reductase